MHIFRLNLVLLFSAVLAACATSNGGTDMAGGAGASAGAGEVAASEAPGQEGVAPDSKDYVIGADDQLQVNVWRNPDLSVSVPVRPDGMISVPLIGDVEAGGRTPEQVSTAIEEDLAEYLKTPRVTVIVTDLRSHQYTSRVRVTGAVESPISLPYRPGMTVLDAVLEAGGLSDFAAANRTKLYRRSGEDPKVREIRLKNILAQGDLETNVALRPGDVISVPERLF